jgi:hypothetical protein
VSITLQCQLLYRHRLARLLMHNVINKRRVFATLSHQFLVATRLCQPRTIACRRLRQEENLITGRDGRDPVSDDDTRASPSTSAYPISPLLSIEEFLEIE